jgi:hypothetical protein
MKNVIITGPTDMVGNLVVRQCLTHREVGNVTNVTCRKLTSITNPSMRIVTFVGISKICPNECIYYD